MLFSVAADKLLLSFTCGALMTKVFINKKLPGESRKKFFRILTHRLLVDILPTLLLLAAMAYAMAYIATP